MGKFTTPEIIFGEPHNVTFTPVTQFLISFQPEDNMGTHSIVPTSFQIQVNDPTIINVGSSPIWLDAGSKFQIYTMLWQGVDVKPAGSTVYTVSAPINQTVLGQVFEAKVVATDYLGRSISGATLRISLANGSLINMQTTENGTVNLGLIPIGTFQGTLSYPGFTTPISGNASVQTQTTVKVFASYPTLELIFGVIVFAAVVMLWFLFVHRKRGVGRRDADH